MKRTADNLVANGEDISNFELFVSAINTRLKSIFFGTVTERDIKLMKISKRRETVYRNNESAPMKMGVEKSIYNFFNTLSCYDCLNKCKHFYLGELKVQENATHRTVRKRSKSEIYLF